MCPGRRNPFPPAGPAMTRGLSAVTLLGGPPHPVDLRFEDGRIAAIAPSPHAPFRRLLAMPALANAHDHARPLSPTSFGAAGKPLETWLLRLAAMPAIDPYPRRSGGVRARRKGRRRIGDGASDTLSRADDFAYKSVGTTEESVVSNTATTRSFFMKLLHLLCKYFVYKNSIPGLLLIKTKYSKKVCKLSLVCFFKFF